MVLDFLLKGFVLPEGFKVASSLVIFAGALFMVAGQLQEAGEDFHLQFTEIQVIAGLMFLNNFFSCFSENRIN